MSSCVVSPLSDPRAHPGWPVVQDFCPADPSFSLENRVSEEGVSEEEEEEGEEESDEGEREVSEGEQEREEEEEDEAVEREEDRQKVRDGSDCYIETKLCNIS